MPKYLKNKRRRRHSSAKFKSVDNISMNSSADNKKSVKQPKEKTSFRILSGKKQANRVKRIIIACVTFALVLTLFIVSLASPTGLYELVTNFTATFSLKSELPVNLNGSETYSVSSKSNHLFVLSDSDLSCYSKNGKFSFSDAHGFSSPVMSESEARCLVYDQNGSGVRVYNARELLLTKESQFSVLSADISRNGYFAVASKAESYTSMVTVYNADGETVYEWYCPEETICNVAVAPNGKSVAVSTISVINGMYSSTLYVLEYESADPVFKKEYSSEFIYGINSTSKKNFSVIGEGFCDIISWKNYALTTFDTEYSIDSVKSDNRYTVIVSSRENNDGNASFVIYNNKRENIRTFDFSGSVDDFMIYGKNIVILSRNSVYLIDSDGEIAKKGECGFGVIKIIPTSSGGCLAIGHNSIAKISLQ